MTISEGTKVRLSAAAVWLALLAATILLTSCAAPAVEERIVEVSKPVAVHPIKPADIPALPAPLPPRPASLSAVADLLLSKWCEAVGYFLKSQPKLQVSAGVPPTDPQRYPECEGR